jgi:hypothetical protein
VGDRKPPLIAPRIVNIIAVVVTFLWIVNIFAHLVSPNCEPSLGVEGDMTFLLAAALGAAAEGRRNG